jgi:SAM-dependent methyltransferase
MWSRVAAGWERRWETFERAAQGVSDRLVELARIGPGDRVLDLATGVGEPALTAARRVGPTGRVAAVDQSPHMLAVARRRMAALGLTNVEFREADIEALDLAGPFEAILSRWGLMFLTDLDHALARLADLLQPGRGRLAAAVWGPAERVPMIGLRHAVTREVLGLEPPPGSPTPFDLADAGPLAERVARAGFEDVLTETVPVTFVFDSVTDFVHFSRETAPPPPALAQLPPERLEQLWPALARAAEGHVIPGGGVRLENDCVIVAASRRAPRPRNDPATATHRPASRPPSGSSSTAKLQADAPLAAPGSVRCPFCGGTDTRLESLFGSTLGFSQYWCARCRTVFEYLKWEEPPAAGS